jgi:hypothetical protein
VLALVADVVVYDEAHEVLPERLLRTHPQRRQLVVGEAGQVGLHGVQARQHEAIKVLARCDGDWNRQRLRVNKRREGVVKGSSEVGQLVVGEAGKVSEHEAIKVLARCDGDCNTGFIS